MADPNASEVGNDLSATSAEDTLGDNHREIAGGEDVAEENLEGKESKESTSRKTASAGGIENVEGNTEGAVNTQDVLDGVDNVEGNTQDGLEGADNLQGSVDNHSESNEFDKTAEVVTDIAVEDGANDANNDMEAVENQGEDATNDGDVASESRVEPTYVAEPDGEDESLVEIAGTAVESLGRTVDSENESSKHEAEIVNESLVLDSERAGSEAEGEHQERDEETEAIEDGGTISDHDDDLFDGKMVETARDSKDMEAENADPGTEQVADDEQSDGETASKSDDVRGSLGSSRVTTATAMSSELLMDTSKPLMNALNLTWAFGMSQEVAVLNLSDNHRRVVVYPCSNAVVIYDYAANKQKILQGHRNTVSCTAVSGNKRWLATGDSGPNNTIIIWDTYTGIPVQTIFDPYPGEGCIALTLSPDAKYLVSLSAGEHQTLSVWDWTSELQKPACFVLLPPGSGFQNYVQFHPEDNNQIVSNNNKQVIFYMWSKSDMKVTFHAPPLTDQDFWKVVGDYSMSIFLPGTTCALTATLAGNIVVWDNNTINGVQKLECSCDKRALKLVNLQEGQGITVLTQTDSYVVTGDLNGVIKFFDKQLRVCNWYHKFGVGPQNAISFKYDPDFSAVKTTGDFTFDATIKAHDFVVRDFVFGTYNAVYANVTVDGTKLDIISKEHDDSVCALASHPTMDLLAIGSYSGIVKVWDFAKKTVLCHRFLAPEEIQTMAYDPSGLYLAIGTRSGSLRVVDGLTIVDEIPKPFTFSKRTISVIAFSHDSRFMATADADRAVTVYQSTTGKKGPFTFLGRHRSHYKQICGLTFGVALDSDSPRLLSLGKDRVMVEYDLENSSLDCLKIMSTEKVEQSGIPQCLIWYPPVVKEDFICTANDQFKVKLYNSTTKMCRKTVLSPTYGSPLQRMELVPCDDTLATNRCFAYVTTDKVGLLRLPLDGNPHNSVATIAHPGGVANLAMSHDGQYLFTAGGRDTTVLMWTLHLPALEAQHKLGGDDLIPFYGLLEGGRDGHLFRELEDYFYYAMIGSQDVNTMDTRRVSTKIPLSEVPFVMRALGFYPSEHEIRDMINEIKFSDYIDTKTYIDEIDIGEFIKLYINHRPAFGIDPHLIYDAFNRLTTERDAHIQRSDFLDMLQSKGEKMTEAELAEYLVTLLGESPLGGVYEIADYDAMSRVDVIEKKMPKEITANQFAQEILGFDLKVAMEYTTSTRSRSSLRTSDSKRPLSVEIRN